MWSDRGFSTADGTQKKRKITVCIDYFQMHNSKISCDCPNSLFYHHKIEYIVDISHLIFVQIPVVLFQWQIWWWWKSITVIDLISCTVEFTTNVQAGSQKTFMKVDHTISEVMLSDLKNASYSSVTQKIPRISHTDNSHWQKSFVRFLFIFSLDNPQI